MAKKKKEIKIKCCDKCKYLEDFGHNHYDNCSNDKCDKDWIDMFDCAKETDCKFFKKK